MGSSESFRADFLAGAEDARYRLEAHVASGGMGDVYLATRHLPSGSVEPVALKCVRAGLVDLEQFAEALEIEARIATLLRHANVARIYELGSHAGRPFLAMEFLLGDTVETLLRVCRTRALRPSIGVTTRIVADAARGLAHAHTMTDATGQPLRIVHRDVSPQNLFVTAAGITKVLDFGIATAAIRYEQTQPGVLKGKFAYLSPERVRVQAVDHRSDLFSLGIVAWEMLTGERLFHASNMVTTLHAVVNRPVPRVRDVRPEVSPELDAIVARLLERLPHRRWQSAREVVEALDAAAPAGADERDVAAFVREVVGEAVSRRQAIVERLLADSTTRAPAFPVPLDRHPAAPSPLELEPASRRDPTAPAIPRAGRATAETGPAAAPAVAPVLPAPPSGPDVELVSLPHSDEQLVEHDPWAEDTVRMPPAAEAEVEVEPTVEQALTTMLAEWDRQSSSALGLDASLRAIIEDPTLPAEAKVGMHDLALGLLTRVGAPLEVRAHHAWLGSDPFLGLALLGECGETALRWGDRDSAVRWYQRGLELARRALVRGELDDGESAVVHFSCKLSDVLLGMGDAVTAQGILREAEDVAPDADARARLSERLERCGVVRASRPPRA